MKRHIGVVSIFLALGAFGADEPPKEKVFTTTQTVETEPETFTVGSTRRSVAIFPANWGTAGIFRVRSAESLPDGALTFGIGGEFYSISNAPNFGFGGGNANSISESIFVGFAPTRNLTVAVQRRNSSTTFGTPKQLISSLGDFNFTGQYSFPLSTVFALAPFTNVLVASDFNSLAPAGTTVSVGLGTALTASLFPATGQAIFVHANVTYHVPQIRTGKVIAAPEPEAYFHFSRFHTLAAGLGAEWKLGDATPFLELQQTVNFSSGLSWGDSPSTLSLGARFTPLANKSLAVLIGGDVGLGRGLRSGVPYSPSYQIIGQVSYTVGLSDTERKHYQTTSDVKVVDRRFVLRENIRFKVGSAELDPSSSDLLDQIARVVKENDVRKLLIVGHTDSSHTEDYNLKLSQDRATTVKRYLVAKGIGDETFLAQGYGKRRPKASNTTDEGRSQNRRVEFLIVE